MSISGHEPRFREMFREEAWPSLDRLSRNLLALESATADPDLVDSMFRDAHNLKGGAAMVGLEEVRSRAHTMEDLLEPLRRAEAVATPEVTDALLASVDAIRAALAPDGGEDARAQPVEDPPAAVPAPPPAAVPTPPPAAPSVATTTASEATMPMPVARIDEIARLVGEGAGAHSRLGRFVSETLRVDPTAVTEYRELAGILNHLEERSTRARMVPVSVLADSLQRVVRDLARQLGKSVRWEASGTETEMDRSLVDQLAGPLLHIVRNAVDHGIETPEQRRRASKPEQGRVCLSASHVGPDVVITITDDGQGIDIERVRAKAATVVPDLAARTDADVLDLIFHSGLSTATEVTDVSGRGVGLDVVRANLEAVRGRIDVSSRPGQSTEFRVTVPVTLSVLQCLIVRCSGQAYAVPLHSVASVLPADAAVARADGKTMVWLDGEPVPLSDLAATLTAGAAAGTGPAVVLTGGAGRHAVRVNEILGLRSVVVNALSALLPRLPIYAGASAEPDGSVLLVLDGNGLIDRARAAGSSVGTTRASMVETTARSGDVSRATQPRAGDDRPEGHAARTVLVVDDAMTVRELQRSILDRAGYTVITAGDGVDALEVAELNRPDLVLTDIEMPRMNGFELTRALRAHPQLSGVGVLVLTTLGGEEDRRLGMDAGADGYLVKRQFDEATLLAAVERVLGEQP
jgi:two-component system chemotaxis sensor kinase CheA